MLDRIGRVALPPWLRIAVSGVLVLSFVSIGLVTKPNTIPDIHVAFIGNSMQYYNDLPRFMETLADGRLRQNSCLHGDANLKSLLVTGNGMYEMWKTGSARVTDYDKSVHDFGACTVPQLLFGYDDDLDSRVQQLNGQGDDHFGAIKYSDDFFTFNDGKNPCLRSSNYYDYLRDMYEAKGQPVYDYIVINDNTRSPARYESRKEGLATLQQYYIPWLLELGATPVLLFTYGYWTPYRDMGDLGNVPEFTSLTYEGYRQYAALLAQHLPASQKPRIAPVGFAFLLVWEENYQLWQRLFHVDQIHNSPMGTYLQGLVIHHTLFGVMPNHNVAIRGDMSSLWLKARRFQPGEHRRSPFPSKEDAAYLYHIAVRVCVYGHIPQSFIFYHHGEAAYYTPMDDLYRVDDIF